MAEEAIERTHYYHADASAIGGYITRPFTGNVPSEAAVSLPVVGGLLNREHKGRKWKNVVSYASATTTVSGRKQTTTSSGQALATPNGPWITEVTAAVNGLNIREIVTAERVVAQITVVHPHEGYNPKIYVTGSQIVGLRITGIPITPIINYDLFEGFEAAANGYPAKPWYQQESFLQHAKRQYQQVLDSKEEIPSWMKHHYHWIESGENGNTDTASPCSIVEGFEGVPKNFPGKVCGHAIYVRDFGKIYFGELLVQGGTYTLSMIRAQLGSPVGGAVSAATAHSNGLPYP